MRVWKMAACCCAGLLTFLSLGWAQEPLSWRNATNGGLNVLYCYLHINGGNCTYADLCKKQIEEARTGPCTASTLARIAARHGVQLQTTKLTLAELESAPLPIIVHMDGESPGAGAFLMLLSIGARVYYINGPSATLEQMEREDFYRVWSGFALVQKPRQRERITFALIGLALGGVVLPRVIRARRTNPQQGSQHLK